MLPRLEKAEERRAVIDLICMVPHLDIATNQLTGTVARIGSSIQPQRSKKNEWAAPLHKEVTLGRRIKSADSKQLRPML